MYSEMYPSRDKESIIINNIVPMIDNRVYTSKVPIDKEYQNKRNKRIIVIKLSRLTVAVVAVVSKRANYCPSTNRVP